MKITLLCDQASEIPSEIARFIRRAGEGKISISKMLGGKRRQAKAAEIAAEFESLAQAISEMEVVSSKELFETKPGEKS